MQISGNGNVFTFKFSDAQFKKLDKNNDGVLSQDELQNSGLFNFNNDTEWLTNTAPKTGETNQTQSASGTNTQTTLPTTSSDVPETANSAVELRTYFTKLKDNFIQEYIKEQLASGALNESDRKDLITYLNQNARSYIEKYIKENSKGPYDINSIYAGFETYINERIEARKNLETEVKEKLEGYKQNTDTTFNELAEMIEKADQEYITAEEYEEIKNKATDFIIGQMLNGKESKSFFEKLDPKYQNNFEYKKIQSAIEKLKTETDPVAIDGLIKTIEESVKKMIGNQRDDGTSTVYDGVKALQTEINNEKYSSVLDENIDSTLETYSQGSVSETDVKTKQAFLNNLKASFLAQYKGNGENIVAEFEAYVQQVEAEQKEVSEKLDTTYNIDSLDTAIKNAGSYANADEQENINNILTSLIMNNALSGDLDSFLNNIGENLTNNPQYAEAKALLDGLKSSTTPKEDYEKALSLVKEIVKNIPTEDIEKAINTEKSKTIQLSNDSTLTSYLWGYKNNDTYGGDDKVYTNFTIKDGKVEWTNNNDKGDLNKTFNQLNERIHSKLKEQLGELYNKEQIDQYINQSMVEMVMNLQNPGALYSVDTLVNSFLKEFDKIATAGLKGESSTSNKMLDKTAILEKSGAISRYDDGTVKGDSRFNSSKSMSSTKGLARDRLNALKNTIIEQLKATLGDKYDSAAIEKIIDSTITSTVDGYKYWDANSRKYKEQYAFNAKALYDNFFNNMEANLQKYMKETGISL